MTKNKKGFKWDGKSRVVTDVYRKRFTEIFGKKIKEDFTYTSENSLWELDINQIKELLNSDENS